jgi:hypothetical protein
LAVYRFGIIITLHSKTQIHYNMKKLLFAAFLLVSLSTIAQEPVRLNYLMFTMPAIMKAGDPFDQSIVTTQLRESGMDAAMLADILEPKVKTQLQFMNMLGAQGYELVSSYPITYSMGATPVINYIFKRHRP